MKLLLQVVLSGMLLTMIGCAGKDNSKKADEKAVEEMNMTGGQIAPDILRLKCDTLGLRCYELVYKPGDSIRMHRLPERVFYAFEAGKMEYTMEDGTKVIAEFNKGETYIRPARVASSRNIGNTDIKGIIFHILRPNEGAVPYDAAKDAAKVEPEFYKVLADTNNIRVIMATYPPGRSSRLHGHPDYISYVIKGGKTQIINKDGSQQNGELVAGTSGVFEGSEHVFKNIDTAAWQVLMVEVNRSRVSK